MRHLILVIALLTTTSSLATGQPRRGGFGGGFRGPPPAGTFRMIQAPPLPRTPGLGFGFYGGYGYGGGLYGGGLYGGYAPYYVLPEPPYPPGGGPVEVPAPAAPLPAPVVSGILPATLVLQFPAPAKVWLDGVEVPGDPETIWTFTSKDLRPGESATFNVRGRWQAGGKTYESAREVPLGPGARSRLLVVSGTEVRE